MKGRTTGSKRNARVIELVRGISIAAKKQGGWIGGWGGGGLVWYGEGVESVAEQAMVNSSAPPIP